MSTSTPHEGPAVLTYVAVYIGLLVLLGLTVGAYYLPITAFALAIAMAISVAKSGLVIFWFMHVRYESKLVRVVSMVGFFWLGLLLILTLQDFIARAAL